MELQANTFVYMKTSFPVHLIIITWYMLTQVWVKQQTNSQYLK